MEGSSEKEIAQALLKRHEHTFACELGIPVERNTPSPLFRLLYASLLFSTRTNARIAVKAARVLVDEGWVTAEKMASSTWQERGPTLNEAGYARYDERTATMLGETAGMLLDRYSGDLRT